MTEFHDYMDQPRENYAKWNKPGINTGWSHLHVDLKSLIHKSKEWNSGFQGMGMGWMERCWLEHVSSEDVMPSVVTTVNSVVVYTCNVWK